MKKNKYTFIVDLTNCTTDNDVYNKFVYAKIDNKLPITIIEYSAIIGATVGIVMEAKAFVDSMTDILVNAITATIEKDSIKKETKPNIFKRFWNWMTGKN